MKGGWGWVLLSRSCHQERVVTVKRMRIQVSLFKRSSTWTTKSGAVRKSWVYWARWRQEIDGVMKDKARSLGTQDRHEADRMRFELEDRLNSPAAPAKPPRPARLDWKAAENLHLRYHCVGLTKGTIDARCAAWRAFWAWAPVEYLDEVQELHVLEWRGTLEAGGNGASTINQKVRACATLVRQLEKSKLYEGENAFEGLRTLPEAEVHRDWLVGAEVDTILARAVDASEDLYLFCLLSLRCGLRAPSECLAARWRWIHWPENGAGGYIRIPKTDEGGWSVKDREARTIPLANGVVEVLRPRRGMPGAFIVAPQHGLIPGRRHRWPVNRYMGALRFAIPGKELTAYSMRHSFATACLQNGCDPYKVMRWMGHSKLEMLQRYEHLMPYDDSIDLAFPTDAVGTMPG